MTDEGGQGGYPSEGGQGARPDDPGAPVLVSTSEAARLAGVNPRTVRRWIERGYLPVVQAEGGALVSPSDLPAARAWAAQAGGGGRPQVTRPGARPDNADTPDARPGGYPPALSESARSQLEAIRDEWLAPLVARNEELARENGRLGERLSSTEQERDALRRRVAELEAEHRRDAPGATGVADTTGEPQAGLMDRLRRWFGRS